jgi:hypothetical protein
MIGRQKVTNFDVCSGWNFGLDTLVENVEQVLLCDLERWSDLSVLI